MPGHRRDADARHHPARPLAVFDEDEAPMLLPVPPGYDVPIFKQVTAHRDFHAEVAKALYSIPGQ